MQPKVAYRYCNGVSAFDPAVRRALIFVKTKDGQKYLLESTQTQNSSDTRQVYHVL